MLLGVLSVVEVVEVLLESVVLPFASVDFWCFLCFLVVVVSPFASVEVVVLVALCVVSVFGVLPACEAASLLLGDCAASLWGMEAASLFIESLLAASVFLESLLVEEVEVVVLCASAGFTGAVACDINFGVVALLSAFGVVLSDCGVAVASGVVVVVVLEFVVVLLVLAPFASVAGFAQG